jgi:hypothetical protein
MPNRTNLCALHSGQTYPPTTRRSALRLRLSTFYEFDGAARANPAPLCYNNQCQFVVVRWSSAPVTAQEVRHRTREHAPRPRFPSSLATGKKRFWR